MDEFEVSHTSRSIPVPESGHELAEAEDESTDLLGLDQPLKLVSRAKIAKIDDERMLTNPNGIKYIAKNYSKVNRIIKKNDLKLSQKIAKSSNLTSSAQRRLKYENEYNNLSSILQFYQLWCHGLFPKANFKDCLKLIRVYGGKSSHMKLYRRELLDQQILKLKQEKGIIDENPLDNLDMEMSMDSGIGLAEPLASVQQISSTAVEQNGNNGGDDDDDEDDWSFMNRSTRSKNSLFIDDDDDDLYTTPSTHPQTLQTTSSIQQQQQNTTISTAASNELPDFSDFSDEETKNPSNEGGEGDDYEMDLMREMGL